MPPMKRKYSRKYSGNLTRAKTVKLVRQIAAVNASGQVMAGNKQRVKLCWGFNNIIQSAATSGTQVMNMNSLFDPDRTGTGDQPVGFDQWSAFYNRYIVYKFKVEWYVQSSLGQAIATMGSNQDTAATVPTMLGNPMSHIYATNSDERAHGVEYYDLAKLTGRTLKEYMADDRFQALTSASPSELCVWRIRTESPSATNTNAELTAKLTFWCEFFDRNQLATS